MDHSVYTAQRSTSSFRVSQATEKNNEGKADKKNKISRYWLKCLEDELPYDKITWTVTSRVNGPITIVLYMDLAEYRHDRDRHKWWRMAYSWSGRSVCRQYNDTKYGEYRRPFIAHGQQ